MKFLSSLRCCGRIAKALNCSDENARRIDYLAILASPNVPKQALMPNLRSSIRKRIACSGKFTRVIFSTTLVFYLSNLQGNFPIEFSRAWRPWHFGFLINCNIERPLLFIMQYQPLRNARHSRMYTYFFLGIFDLRLKRNARCRPGVRGIPPCSAWPELPSAQDHITTF